MTRVLIKHHISRDGIIVRSLEYSIFIDDAIFGKEKLCVIIDDYGIQRGLKLFFDKLRSNENVVIVEHTCI